MSSATASSITPPTRPRPSLEVCDSQGAATSQPRLRAPSGDATSPPAAPLGTKTKNQNAGDPGGDGPQPLSAGATLLSEPGALTTPMTAEYVGLRPATLETLRVRGGGPTFLKLGAGVVYQREDLDQWLGERKRTSTSDPGSDKK